MNAQDEPRAESTLSETDGRRLDSWKEIAAHLQRDVRTVQRWHRRAGLPVHRHLDPQQRGVFAFEQELTAWASQVREDTGEPDSETVNLAAAPPEPGRRRLNPVVWLAAGLIMLTGSLTLWALRTRASPPVPFQQRDWVLVAAIDNRTGDDLLENTVQYTLEQQLKASSFVNVIPRERVKDILRLMRRSEDSPLTLDVAREVSVRDGGIQAIVTGRVDRIDSGYLLSVQVIDPQSGATVLASTDRAPAQGEVIDGVNRLAWWLRGALGEHDARSRQNVHLPRVTTRSLNALKLYGQAEQAMPRNYYRAARQFLESAVRDDPDFASAHVLLAAALARDPDVRQMGTAINEHLERALILSSNLVEEERLRILITYHSVRGQDDEQAAACEALVRLRPDDWEAHANLGYIYQWHHRTREGIAETERAAALRPNDFRSAVGAAQAWAVSGGEPDRALPYVERARVLWPAQAAGFSSQRLGIRPAAYSIDVAWALLFPAYDRWRSGDLNGMLAAVRGVLDTEPLAKGNERDAFLNIAVGFSMTTGRLHEARELAQQMVGNELREVMLAQVADVVDDFPTVRAHLLRVPGTADGRALRSLRAGLYQQAERMLGPGNQFANAVAARAEIALRRGHRTEGIEMLRKAIEMSRIDRLSERYLAAESLATELQRMHKSEEAIQVLEAAVADVPRYAPTGVSAGYWLRVLGRLAREYETLGRDQDAAAMERKLRELLMMADADHPLVLQLAHINRSSAGR